jgi:hypothetical protein
LFDSENSIRPWKDIHHRVSGRKKDNVGQYNDLAVALFDGPKTLEEIKEHYESYLRLLGIFTPLTPFKFNEEEWDREIKGSISVLEDWGWVEKSGNKFVLTRKGLSIAEKALLKTRKTRNLIIQVIRPETVSKISTGAHIFLSMVKLPAAILSGSVGLLNDSMDTLLDGLSSTLVYYGYKYDKERTVNLILIFLMLMVAGFALFEAIERFLVPFSLQVDWFTFAATILSATVCGSLYLYQRYVGWRVGSISLITQSVDSRNHVIVAVSVTAGLIASITNYAIIDTLVGLGVSLIILKSVIELLLYTIRSIGGDYVDVSRYRVPFIERYASYRQRQLRNWLLYRIQRGEAKTIQDLKRLGKDAYDFSNNPMLREVGIAKISTWEKDLNEVMNGLVEEGFIEGVEEIKLTNKCKNLLKKIINRKRYYFH